MGRRGAQLSGLGCILSKKMFASSKSTLYLSVVVKAYGPCNIPSCRSRLSTLMCNLSQFDGGADALSGIQREMRIFKCMNGHAIISQLAHFYYLIVERVPFV